MEIVVISLLLVTFSLLLAFLNGIVAEAQLEEFEKSCQKPPHKQLSICENKTIISTSFLFFEIFFYLISLHLITIHFIFLSFILRSLYIFLILYFIAVSVFIIRMVLYFVGERFSNKLLPQFSSIIYLFFLLFRFSGYFIHWMQKKITAREEEATLEDIQEVVETAHDEGTIQTGEYKIFTNVIKFNQVPVSDVMTPRTVIFSCNADMTVGEALKFPETKIFSRFPIFEGNSLDDKVVGYVVTKDLLQAALNNKLDAKLREFSREIYFIPEHITLDDALNQFLSKRQHIFLVVDEFGDIEGLVTMEDLIETILGEEIIDEADKYIDLREVAKRKRDNRLKISKDTENSKQNNS